MELLTKDYKATQVTFSNYNYSFFYFYQKYKEICLSISDTMDLFTVNRKISAFIYEFSYSIPSKTRWNHYKRLLKEVNKELQEDETYNKLINAEELSFKQEIQGYPIYYRYFLRYLEILSNFVSELTSTYMPRTSLQKKLLRFSNNMPFYEKLHEYKNLIFDSLSDFNIRNFRKIFNEFITYYYAYKLFINEKYINDIDLALSHVISLFINDETIKILSNYPEFTTKQLSILHYLESLGQEGLLYCNSLVNDSFSSYGILPKIEEKVYIDRTLI